jgi:ChrR-like protein with cupin domain
MNLSRYSSSVIVCLMLGFVVTVTAGFSPEHHIVVPAETVKWAPAPPALPPGAQISVLEGNPAEKGPVVMRLRFPADYVVPPHWHSMTERITVLSGTFYIGSGDKVDRAATQPLSLGGFVSLPAKMHHYAWVKTPTVVQINLEGPFDLFYVNPADDPQKKAATP